jgi:hypothetical protein
MRNHESNTIPDLTIRYQHDEAVGAGDATPSSTPIPTAPERLRPNTPDHLAEMTERFDKLVPADLSPDAKTELGKNVRELIEAGIANPEVVSEKDLTKDDQRLYRVAWTYSEFARMSVEADDNDFAIKFHEASERLGLSPDEVLSPSAAASSSDPSKELLEGLNAFQDAAEDALRRRMAAEVGPFSTAAWVRPDSPADPHDTERPDTVEEAGVDEGPTAPNTFLPVINHVGEHPSETLERTGKYVKAYEYKDIPLTKRREMVDAVMASRAPRSWELAQAHDNWRRAKARGERVGPEPTKETQPNNTLRATTKEEQRIVDRVGMLKRRLELATTAKNNEQKVFGGPPGTFRPTHPRQHLLDPQKDREELITLDAQDEVTQHRYKRGVHGREDRRGKEKTTKIERVSDIGLDSGDQRLADGSYSDREKIVQSTAGNRVRVAEKEIAEIMEEIEELRRGEPIRSRPRRIATRLRRAPNHFARFS